MRLKVAGSSGVKQQRRAGVTLLEVLLAVGLLVLVSSMTFWFYRSSLEVRNKGTQEAYRLRLTRSFLTRIATEIRQASPLSNEGQAGIRGEAEQIRISTLRMPSKELAEFRSPRAQPLPAEYDVGRVEYKIARHPDILTEDGYERALGIARVEQLRPGPGSAQTGRAGNAQENRGADGQREDNEKQDSANENNEEVDQNANSNSAAASPDEMTGDGFGADENGGPNLGDEIAWEELYVPELHFLRFCYFDGHSWWDSWQVEGENPLPQMVMVTVGFEDHPPFGDQGLPRELEEFCTCLNQDPVDCAPLSEDQFSIVVRVPLSDPLFRSRVARESQSILERLSAGAKTDEQP